ncbi:MAG: hypothetical protein HXY22_07040 [Alphaproteobacteria bacterium]|nr:hypothetical protein [Alphaproteobacteria bacterium]
MRTIFAIITSAMLASGAAFAADMTPGGAFGNTITITNAKSEVTKLFINEDMSYEATLPDGAVHKGTWAVAADQICFTQTEPAPAADAKPVCGLVQPDKKAGDTWEQGEGEQKITVAITAGR